MSGLFVVTGGPGTGKSTLIDALRSDGLSCYSEVSRKIIAEANRLQSDLLPWSNLRAFAEECHSRMRKQVAAVEPHRLYFFDRGIPDIIAYLRHGGLTPHRKLYSDGRCYDKLALVAPPWEDIYVNDDERPQSFEECKQLHNLIVDTYKELGYAIVSIPKVTVAARKEFVISTVLDFCKSRSNKEI